MASRKAAYLAHQEGHGGSLWTSLPAERPHDWRPQAPPSLSGIRDIQLNFETTGLKWWDGDKPIGIGLRLPNGHTQYLPWGHRGGGNLEEAAVKEWALRELRGKRITNINTKFDVHMARVWGLDLEGQGNEVSDVAHYAALLDDHRKRFNLDELTEDFIGPQRVPRVVNAYGVKDESRMEMFHAGEVAARAEYQVELVHQLTEVFWPRLDAEDLQRVRALEDEVIYPTEEMEWNGCPIDEELLDRWVKETDQEYQRLLWNIYRETGMSINPDSPKDLEKVFAKYNLPVTTTALGNSSFTNAVLAAIDHPVIRMVVEASLLLDLRIKYLLPYQKNISAGGILRYALHQLRSQKDEDDGGGAAGTVSGRFSSSKLSTKPPVGVNIQQIMKVAKQILKYGNRYIIRQLHRPARGLWLSADAKQIEYRIFASYAGTPKVVAAYRENPDLSFHKFIWGLIKPYKELTYRQQKDLNFAKIYGAGLIKMGQMLGMITAQEAAEFKANKDYNNPKLQPVKEVNRIYNRELPEVAPLLERAGHIAKPHCDRDCVDRRTGRKTAIHEKYQHQGYVRTVLGRRGRFPDGHRIHKALNTVIQGGAADVAKRKAVELHRARAYTQFTMRYVVHDENDGDIPDQEHAKRVSEVLDTQSFPEFSIPILWDVSTGRNWFECSEEFQEQQQEKSA
jgi:DNA polymerase I-like protein with 3'-5' exonuclease and polymerase domains